MNILRLGTPPFILRLITPYRKHQKLEKIKKKRKTVFILSTGRTGTQFFANFFNQHPKITAFHEPKPSRILRMWSIARIENKVDGNSMAKVLYRKRRKLVSEIKTPIYLESNPYLFGAADCLGQVFQDPVVINIVRDPRTYIQSSLNHGNTKGLKNFLNNFMPFWYPKTNEILGVKSSPSLIIRNAQYWRILNDWLEKSCGTYKNYYFFKFEDLFLKNDLRELERLAGIIGADKNFVRDSVIKVANKSKDTVIPSWQNWQDSDCKKVENICQPLMEKYGYGQEKDWLKKIS